MRSIGFAIAAAAALAPLAVQSATVHTKAVNVEGKLTCVLASSASDAMATAIYSDDVEADGWGKLWVTARPEAPSKAAALSAGCAQARVMQHRMFQYWDNYAANEYGKSRLPCSQLEAFIDAQMAYSDSLLQPGAPLPAGSPPQLLDALAHLSAQFDGLVQGYSAVAPPAEAMSRRTIYMLNAVGDLEDLNGICSASFNMSSAARAAVERLAGRPYPARELASGFRPTPEALKLTDCSGFVGLTPDGSDLVFGQATWRAYYAMLRTYTVYHLPYTPANVMSFSASPGFLMSKDDYAATGGDAARLMIFETTNSMFNHSRFEEFLTPESILTWQRSAMGMQWATSGKEYADIMMANQSGTYNNQWVVADAKQFNGDGRELKDDLLWVVELAPGITHAADMTSTLQQQHYWPSYNIPYFVDVYNASGYPAKAEAFGDDFIYSKAPRANIFRRNASQVTSVADAGRLLRYNNYQHDPLAKDDPILGA